MSSLRARTRRGERARGEASGSTPGPCWQPLSWDVCAQAKTLGGHLTGSQGRTPALLVGEKLTCGTLPEVHGVTGPSLESRLQGLVSLPPGCRET